MPDLKRVSALLVGAGAVGQVFGYHLAKAGVEVSYQVKPKYREEVEEGFTLHRLTTFGKRNPLHFEDFDVYCGPEEWTGNRFDQIWLCISSPAMRRPWLDDFLQYANGATLVSTQPGFEDRAYLEARYPAEMIVSGMIGFVAYQAPLPGEELWPSGLAYWFPPLSPSPFCGDEERALSVVHALQQGQCPAGYREDTLEQAATGSSVLMPFVVALETAGWDLRRLRESSLVDLLAEALDQSTRIACAHHGNSRGFLIRLASNARLLKLGMRLADPVTPFDFETYFQYHFSKVRDQTQQQMRELIQLGGEHGLDTNYLRELTGMWTAARKHMAIPELGEVGAA